MNLFLPALLLCASLAAQADSGEPCLTVDAKADAVEAFIFEHYEGWGFLSISPQEDGSRFEVRVYPDVDYTRVCMGFVRVTDDCQVTSESGAPLDSDSAIAQALPCYRE